jgi:hypothetical protein
MLASYTAAPRLGNFNAMFPIFAFLHHHQCSRLVLMTVTQSWNLLQMKIGMSSIQVQKTKTQAGPVWEGLADMVLF